MSTFNYYIGQEPLLDKPQQRDIFLSFLLEILFGIDLNINDYVSQEYLSDDENHKHIFSSFL